MDSSALKDIAIIATPFFIFALGVVVAAVGFLLKGLINGLKDDTRGAVEKTGRVERELMDFKAQLPRQYVLKDDYIRSMSNFEHKVDELGKKIDTLIIAKEG